MDKNPRKHKYLVSCLFVVLSTPLYAAFKATPPLPLIVATSLGLSSRLFDLLESLVFIPLDAPAICSTTFFPLSLTAVRIPRQQVRLLRVKEI